RLRAETRRRSRQECRFKPLYSLICRDLDAPCSPHPDVQRTFASMRNVRLLEADYQFPKFRQAQPPRHLALEDPSLTLASAPFSGDYKHEPGIARGRGPQETQKCPVRFALG